MKSKIGLVTAMIAGGALLAACHGDFYGGGDVGVDHIGSVAPHDAKASAANSTARLTASVSDVSGEATTADKS